MFLDTVKLAVRLSQYFDFSQFEYGGYDWDSSKRGVVYCRFLSKESYAKLSDKSGKYEPRVSYRAIRNNGVSQELIIEFSIPKLLHGNNFAPTHRGELEEIFQKLFVSVSNTYGFVGITPGMLKSATLSRMDCMATVRLPDAGVLNEAFSRIKSAKIDRRITIDEPAFSAEAMGVNIHCASWQFVFYDKEKEIMSRDRINGGNYCEPIKPGQDTELTLFRQSCPDFKSAMQCEFRLKGKNQIRNALKKIKMDKVCSHLTLQEMVNNDIPLKLLQFHWELILAGLPRYDLQKISEKELLTRLLLEPNGNISSLSKHFFLASLSRVFCQQELRKLCDKSHSFTWFRSLQKYMDNLPIIETNMGDPVDFITKSLTPNNRGSPQ